MGKHLISSGFIALIIVGWAGLPTASQEHDSHQGATFVSSQNPGDQLLAETDVLNQPFVSFKVIKFFDNDFNAIFFSTLRSHQQVEKIIPQEINQARKKLLLSCLYPAHEFS